MARTTAIGSGLVTALERAYSDVRDNHPELPRVVFITGRGSTGKQKEWRWGHFSRSSWMLSRKKEAPEIFVAGERFKLGAAATFETILHEAAHALAVVRAVKDTSRGHRYHNRRYLQLAEELGLRLGPAEPHATFGFSEVILRPDTKRRYAATIQALREALIAHIPPTSPDDQKPPADRNNLKAQCGCARTIRASRAVLEQGPILCALCGDPFAADGLEA